MKRSEVWMKAYLSALQGACAQIDNENPDWPDAFAMRVADKAVDRLEKVRLEKVVGPFDPEVLRMRLSAGG
jgi:hypothetical protein